VVDSLREPPAQANDFAMLHRFVIAGFVLGLPAALCGCGGPKLVPVSGKVTIDGQPLTSGYVFVMPKDARAAGGKIDAQGRFTLTTNDDGDGCKPGTHAVTVTARQHLSPTRVKHLIPPKYAQSDTSETTVTIDGPTDELVIALTWAGGKPYVESFDGQGDVSGPADAAPAATAKP
jgi:hypothetical protein